MEFNNEVICTSQIQCYTVTGIKEKIMLPDYRGGATGKKQVEAIWNSVTGIHTHYKSIQTVFPKRLQLFLLQPFPRCLQPGSPRNGACHRVGLQAISPRGGEEAAGNQLTTHHE